MIDKAIEKLEKWLMKMHELFFKHLFRFEDFLFSLPPLYKNITVTTAMVVSFEIWLMVTKIS